MIVSNKDMVAVDVKAARTENCKDGSVLVHLYPSKSTYNKIPANNLNTARDTVKRITEVLVKERQAQINGIKIDHQVILSDTGSVDFINVISKQ